MGGGTRPGSLGSNSPSASTVRGIAGAAPPRSRTASARSLGLDDPPAADAGISPSVLLSDGAVQADSGAPTGGTGGSGGGSGAQANAPISCGLDQVIVSLTAGSVPRPDTSKSVCWIRARKGANDPDMLAYTEFSINIEPVIPTDPTKPIKLPFTLTFARMQIASELASIPGAVSRMETHERQHPREWEATIRAELPDLCSRIDTEVTTRVTTHAQQKALIAVLKRIVGKIIDEWYKLLEDSTHSFDGADYPSLHADLASLGVPTYRCVHGVAKRE